MAKRKKCKITKNNLQNTTRKTKDQATRALLKSVVNTGTPEGCAVPVTNLVIKKEFK